MKAHTTRPARIDLAKAQNAISATIIHLDLMSTAIEEGDEETFDETETNMLDCLSSALHWILEANFAHQGLHLNHEVMVTLFNELKEAFE